ncbi:YbjQ family protein [Parvularcula dongshanensis]|uniref:UPF0145 protein GGQ59_002681 n=1 Tax=Parvularcula dongshanensis TaxID=1173995 RepID=A0A840I5Q4_9PROT|nr:YbjQ family protein [Parvularcula dongshanensis]MBB4660137.1 uncharacterized protein YbjQ (UPF0145 family) [Parvularcula dongshanensis]
MIVTTTESVPGREALEPLGLVAGEAILGVNVFRDMFAGIRDIIGGRSGGYQKALREAREHATADMMDEAQRLGADAVVGVDVDYEAITTEKGAMLMVSCNGTAVRLR